MRAKPVGVVLVLLVCALVSGGCSASSVHVASTPTHTPTTAPGLPAAGTVSATIAGLGALSGHAVYGIAADDTAVWVYNPETGDLLRVDPATNQVVASISVGQDCRVGCGNIAIGQGAVWVTTGPTSQVVRIDPQTNKVIATIPISPDQGVDVYTTPGAVWVTDFYANTIFRIDPQTNSIVATLGNHPGANGVVLSAGSLWLCDAHADKGLVRLNPASMQVEAQIDISNDQGLECGGILALDQAVWVTASDGSIFVLERIDPTSTQVRATAPLPDGIESVIVANAQGEWGTGPSTDLYRFDPQSGQAVGKFALTRGQAVALGAGSVWVARGDGTLLRITPAS